MFLINSERFDPATPPSRENSACYSNNHFKRERKREIEREIQTQREREIKTDTERERERRVRKTIYLTTLPSVSMLKKLGGRSSAFWNCRKK